MRLLSDHAFVYRCNAHSAGCSLGTAFGASLLAASLGGLDAVLARLRQILAAADAGSPASGTLSRD